MLPTTSYAAIVIDINDVLFKCPFEISTGSDIPLRKLRTIAQNSNAWFNFEKGTLTEDECYARVASDYKLNPTHVREAFYHIRDSLCAVTELFALLRELKTASNGCLGVFAMTNTPLPYHEVLRSKSTDWEVFDQIFTSYAAGERKPNLGFYHHVLEAISVDPKAIIFIDDQFENVFAARSLGMHGILFENSQAVERSLRNLLGDPIKRGQDFLRRNARQLNCISKKTDEHPSTVVEENWTQLLILEATGDRTLVDFVEFHGRWNFFKAQPQFTTDYYPDDLDTTALGFTILEREKETAHRILDEMLKYVNSDGILLTYFDHERQRVDAGICVNILSFFYKYGRGSDAEPTFRWVLNILQNRAYLEGTRYFDTPECFLWLLSRLLSHSGDPTLHATLKPLLKERVKERIGAAGDALAIAMRILVCDSVGIKNETDLASLLPFQCIDGGWEVGWIYHYAMSGVSVGNRGFTTALAIKAIAAVRGSAL